MGMSAFLEIFTNCFGVFKLHDPGETNISVELVSQHLWAFSYTCLGGGFEGSVEETGGSGLSASFTFGPASIQTSIGVSCSSCLIVCGVSFLI